MKRGFNLIELMVAMIILSMLLTALYQSFSSGQRNATEIMESHQINEEVDRTMQKLIEDVREANYIDEHCPPTMKAAELANHKTSSAENILMFTKINYDFSKEPADLPDGTYNYTQTRVKYYVAKDDEDDPNSTYVLMRHLTPFDNRRKQIDSEIHEYEVLKGLSECIFYRLDDPDSSRSGNLYIRLKIARKDRNEKTFSNYENDILISVMERGSPPE
ncbi:MAG: PulJ/GspJ family protein [Candidatus Rifleibacteriota bacterium]